VVDAYIRPARTSDAEVIATIQLDVWRVAFANVLPESALQLNQQQVQETWRSAIADLPPQHAIFVAHEGDEVVGFAAVAPPSPDEPGTDQLSLSINPLAVMSRWGRRGHGSRLLAAVAEFAEAAQVRHLTTWLLAEDTAGHAFFSSAGWEPDGCKRALDTGGRPLAEVRLHASLDPLSID
jgi:GNAT superfamily N-acetyltransferase